MYRYKHFHIAFFLLFLLCVFCPHRLPGADDGQFSDSRLSEGSKRLDDFVVEKAAVRHLTPAGRCSDSVFIRRVYLGVTGSLPPVGKVKRFLASGDADKRKKLINELLDSESYADYWALKLSDILRVKSEFPIKLWPNAVQAYYRWIHNAVKTNMPADIFAYELLTSSGSNFRVPQVNFYRAVRTKNPDGIAEAAALTFLGRKFSGMSADEQKNLKNFFSSLIFKGTAEWKEEIVIPDYTKIESVELCYPD